jgi:peptidoglycan/LPS O-acetylase OafA/YrhL
MQVHSTSAHSQQLIHPKYRADIDGLRAIAVLAVMGFHAFPDQVRGGFIGVDIFFVISGFLISSILFESFAQERFNLIRFYSRRVKRIFPSLLVVLISCFVFGWYSLLENELAQLGKHIGAGAAFVSNIIFWKESGYFDAAAETKPLLHLWSLGIEEQFYILWPLILWVSWKHRGNLLMPLILLLLLLSFALNIRGVAGNAVAAFYSLQTRAWELLAGSLLAYVSIYKQPRLESFRSGINNNVIGICGIALLGLGLLLITKERSFPGWWAMLPIIGAAFLILSGSHSWTNRVVLSHPILVSVGLISYPLYLWHWPLLTYAHILEGEKVAFGIRAFLVAFAFPLAWLTYKYVEVPIRFGSFKNKSFIYLLIAMICVGCTGLFTFKNNGLPSRNVSKVIHEGDIGHDVFFDYLTRHYHSCSNQDILKEALKFNGIPRCFQSKQNGPVQIVLVGDSLAEHLFIGLAESLPNKNVAYYIKASLPLANNKDFDNIFHSITRIDKPEIVIFSAFWARRIKREAKDFDFQAELARTIDLVSSSNSSIFLVDGTPNFSFDPILCHKERLIWPKVKCSENANPFLNAYSEYFPIFDAVVTDRNKAIHLHVAKYFQFGDSFSMKNGDDLFFRDDRHLNIKGSQYLGRKLVEDNPGLAISN